MRAARRVRGDQGQATKAACFEGIACWNLAMTRALKLQPGDARSVFRQQEKAMNWDRIEGNWAQFKGKVQQQWGKLTDDDLDVISGKRKELAGKIQERYGKQKDAVESDIDNWLSRH